MPNNSVLKSIKIPVDFRAIIHYIFRTFDQTLTETVFLSEGEGMALRLMQQDVSTLRAAYEERKEEYNILRSAGKWSGAILYGGTLLELALKLVICKHVGISQLPTIFQVHDLELLLYCSGQYNRLLANETVLQNFFLVDGNWSVALRYEGSTTQQKSDEFDKALFDPAAGVISFLSPYL
jgi:hypothetical protein